MRDRLRAWLWTWLGGDRLEAQLEEERDRVNRIAQVAKGLKGDLTALTAEVVKQKPRLTPVDHAEFTDPHLGRL